MGLELLGTRVAIECPARWAPVIATLWEPFLVPSSEATDARTLTFVERPGSWGVAWTGEPPVFKDDPWATLENLRHAIVEAVIAADPVPLMLHAATVTREDGALLLAGPTRAGKTRLTLSLLKRGWAYASDDLAPVTNGTVIPFPKPVGVRHAPEWTELGARWAPEWLPEPRDRFSVPASIFPLAPVGGSPIRSLVVLAYVSGVEAHVRRVTPAEATALCTQYVRESNESTLAELAALCRAITTAEIVYGDFGGAVDALERNWLPRVGWMR